MGAGLLFGGAALQGLGSIIGGGKQASAAKEAAQAQVQAAQIAAATQLQKFEEGKAEIQPFVDYGKNALGAVQALTGTGPGATASSVLSAPLTSIPDASYTTFNPTIAQLEQTPGYQFQLKTGQDMVTNQLTAQGGRAISGALGTELLKFREGLAQSTWMDQLKAYESQYAQRLSGIQQGQAEKAQTYNMLTGQVNTGASTGTSLLGAAVNTGGQIAQAQMSAGASQAAGIVGSANALTSGLTSATGAFGNAATLAALNPGGIFSSPTNTPYYNTPDYGGYPAGGTTGLG